ncbi:MAG TPA: cytochrome c family protein [Alphaproteobacteria bacterium]|nr:cytochrome c family protein [Alphaproteobacteria bacterium]HOO50312.1 cytochrome c family protein [Alphaproteobacteria bacterium]
MNMRSNIALSALVCAGIIAWLSGFASRQLVNPAEIKADAVKIEVAETATAGASASKKSGPEPILALLKDADLARGEKVAKACAACHTFDKGGKNGVGPNLYGVVGRKKQSHEGFAYSGSLTETGGDTWTYTELSHFLYKPKAYAKGTKMTYAGLKKTEDRAAVLAYLRSLADAPAALPTEAEISAEAAE